MIKGVFQAIDYSGNGSIETSEFEAFLEHGSRVMHMSQQITEVVTSVVWPVETNPSAGTVRMRDLDKPWLEDALRETRMENKKDEEVLGEKLVFNLAKQTSKGLKESLGVHCEMTNVANVVRLAIRNENKSAAEIDEMSNGDEVRKAREVLKAVRQFNLRKVAKLLDVNVPQPATWGGRSRVQTSEDPAVSLRRLVK
jgi:hypothetical protein